MAGFIMPAFSVGGSGNLGGVDFNVIWTPDSGSGAWSPTVIPSTQIGGPATIVQSPATQMMLIGGAIVAILLVVLFIKS